MSKLEKSPKVIAQEKEITSLEQAIKKAKTSIKSLKTRKENVEQEFIERQSEVFNKSTRVLEEFTQIRVDIKATLEHLIKDKRFSKEDRETFKDLLSGFDETIEEFGDFTDQFQQHEQGQKERAKERKFFEPFVVEVSKVEKKNIRNLYLQLSKEFHPDSIQDKKQKQAAQELQKQIIRAYEANDYQALIDIKNLNSRNSFSEDFDTSADALANKIKALKLQLEQLISQKERLSAELKAFRDSDAGRMLSDTKSAERQGYSLGEITGLDDIGILVEEIKKMLDALEKTKAAGFITEELESLIQPVESSDLESFFMGDLEDFFGEEKNPDPTFPIGTLVQVTQNFTEMEEWDAIFPIYGTVEAALLNIDTEEPEYTILIHSKSLKSLPELFFIDQDALGEPIDMLLEVPENYIQPANSSVKAEPRSVQTETFKRIWLGIFLEEVEVAYKLKISEAILSQPQHSIAESWKAYLMDSIKFPQTVVTNDYQKGLWKKGEKLTWRSIVELNSPYFPTQIRIEKSKHLFTEVPLKMVSSKNDSINFLIECERNLAELFNDSFF